MIQDKRLNRKLDIVKLKAAIQAAELTDEKFSEMVGCSLVALKAIPKQEVFNSMAEILGVPPETLLIPEPIDIPVVFSRLTLKSDFIISYNFLMRLDMNESAIKQCHYFVKCVRAECEKYWTSFMLEAKKRNNDKDADAESNKVYQYTRKNQCKKQDFMRLEQLLKVFENPRKWNNILQAQENIITYLNNFLSKCCDIADLLKDSPQNHDRERLDSAKSAFTNILLLIKTIQEDESEPEAFDSSEREKQIAKIVAEWNLFPPCQKYIVADTLNLVARHIYGVTASVCAKECEVLPKEVLSLLMASIWGYAEQPQKDAWAASVKQLETSIKPEYDMDSLKKRLVAALNFDDEVILRFEEYKSITRKTWSAFRFLLMSFELEEYGKIPDIASTLKLLITGQSVLETGETSIGGW